MKERFSCHCYLFEDPVWVSLMCKDNVDRNRLYKNKAVLNRINVSLLLFRFLNACFSSVYLNEYSAVLSLGYSNL